MKFQSTVFMTLLCVIASPAIAQLPYPNKIITVITQFGAGTTADSMVRVVTDSISKETDARFVVKNIPGGLGTIGTVPLVRSAPDGYTIGLCSSSVNSLAGTLFKQLPYDPIKDFTFIAPLAVFPYVISQAPALPHKTLDDLVADAKAHPRKLSYAYASASAQVLSATISKQLGIEALAVPYKATTDALKDLASNELSYVVMDLGVSVPMAKAGRVKPLAVILPKRSPSLPDVPTYSELGKPAIDFVAWVGVCGPRGLPQEAVTWLKQNLEKALGRPEMAGKFAQLNLHPLQIEPRSFQDFAAAQLMTWSKAAKDAGLQPE